MYICKYELRQSDKAIKESARHDGTGVGKALAQQPSNPVIDREWQEAAQLEDAYIDREGAEPTGKPYCITGRNHRQGRCVNYPPTQSNGNCRKRTMEIN